MFIDETVPTASSMGTPPFASVLLVNSILHGNIDQFVELINDCQI